MVEGRQRNRICMFYLRGETKEDDTELHFEFVFPKHNQVFFAYSYPFSYEDSEKMLRILLKEAKSLKNIYYKDEILIKSYEGRSVHLLTLSSNGDKEDNREDGVHEELFKYGERAAEFKKNKRIVMISARVHPG